MTVLVKHDPGCKWGRFDGEVDEQANIIEGGFRPGHSDDAKRFADGYNLHKAAGATRGYVGVRYSDGSVTRDVYETREEAVWDLWPYEDWHFYPDLSHAPMTVCQAESTLRWRRTMAPIEKPDRELPHGGLEVIPRLAVEDQEAQIQAVRAGRGLLAMGHRRQRKGS